MQFKSIKGIYVALGATRGQRLALGLETRHSDSQPDVMILSLKLCSNVAVRIIRIP